LSPAKKLKGKEIKTEVERRPQIEGIVTTKKAMGYDFFE